MVPVCICTCGFLRTAEMCLPVKTVNWAQTAKHFWREFWDMLWGWQQCLIHWSIPVSYTHLISLGLPDSLLGSAWPTMYREFSVPVSYAGGISMIIAVGTIISSLLSDRLTKRLGAGKITAVSVFMTAAALFGFSTSHTFIALCLWAVPYRCV